MATQAVGLPGRVRRGAPAEPAWRAYHVHYHADQDRLLRELARPLAGELLRAGAVDRFYFVRYELGGPHLRLRWRATGESAARTAEEALARRAEEFFARWPSLEPVPEEKVRSTNQALLGVDALAHEEGDVVRPDNSWRAAPPGFEVERYGGPGRLPLSLDLFTLSSAAVLRVVEGGEGAAPGARARPAFLRLALQLAWGLADDVDGLAALAGYASRFLGEERFAACRAEGDAIFARRREALVEMTRRELAGGGDPDGLAGAASLLAEGIEGLAAERRWHLAASHLHMTANRLGLGNPEEAYLSRMLERAVEALREEDPDAWARAREGRAAFTAAAAGRALDERAAAALAELAA